MSYIPERYESMYNLTFENEKILKKAKKCVCVNCKNRFNISRVETWIGDESALTAMCPFCLVDSVMPAVIEDKVISDEDLNNLKKIYF